MFWKGGMKKEEKFTQELVSDEKGRTSENVLVREKKKNQVLQRTPVLSLSLSLWFDSRFGFTGIS